MTPRRTNDVNKIKILPGRNLPRIAAAGFFVHQMWARAGKPWPNLYEMEEFKRANECLFDIK